MVSLCQYVFNQWYWNIKNKNDYVSTFVNFTQIYTIYTCKKIDFNIIMYFMVIFIIHRIVIIVNI